MQAIPFIDRAYELDLLKDLLNKKTASLVVIKGRRRIGKSRLVEEFAEKIKILSVFRSCSSRKYNSSRSKK